MRNKNTDKKTESLIKLLQGVLEENGHKTKRFSSSKKHMTTAYDVLSIKGNDGSYYNLVIEKIEDTINPRTGDTIYANETFDSIV